MVHRDGGFNFVRKGLSSSNWRDPYHLLLTLSWSKFLGLFSVVYLLVNSLFAIAYLAGGDGIENARPGNFLDTFFFQRPNHGIYWLWVNVSQNPLCEHFSNY